MLYGLPYTNGTRILSIFVLLILLVCWYNYWIIKKFLLKNKKATLIVGAIIFLVAIFFLKNQSDYKSQASQAALLSYGNISVQDLLNKDSNGNGIPDWKETLYGLDPTKKETADGTPNSVVIERIEAANRANAGNAVSTTTSTNQPQTQTDKFSQELFSTVATLSQTGQMDQSTVDKLTTSLSDQMKNTPPRKIFLISDITVGSDSSVQAYQNYSSALNDTYAKNPIKGNALEVLKEFINDGNNVNVDALKKLDPIIQQTKGFMDKMVKINVPSDISQLHLDVINGLERLIENLSDIQLYNTDVIVTMGAVTKFEDNTNLFQTSIQKLDNAIGQKLSN